MKEKKGREEKGKNKGMKGGKKEGRGNRLKENEGECPLSDETMLYIQKKEIKQHKEKTGKEK